MSEVPGFFLCRLANFTLLAYLELNKEITGLIAAPNAALFKLVAKVGRLLLIQARHQILEFLYVYHGH